MCLKKILVGWWNVVDKQDKKRLASQTPPAEVTREKDIPYIDDGNMYHLLDVYYPENATDNLPTIVDIHGGGWLYGTKEINEYYNMYLASLGYTVVSINYRLCPAVTVFEQVKDCFSAFEWIAAANGTHHIDTSRIYLTGDSAGGHLSMLASYITASDKLREVYDIPSAPLSFRAIGLTCPATDVTGITEKRVPVLGTYAKLVIGDDYRKDARTPYLSATNIVPLADIPPVFVITSDQDFIKAHGLKIHQMLTDKGAECELCYFKKTKEHSLPHVFNIVHFDYEESMQANKAMCAFFDKY